MHQDAFEEIKNRLLECSILHLPDNIGRFQLLSDTSKSTADSFCAKVKMVPKFNWVYR